jgi:hypothetical protein
MPIRWRRPGRPNDITSPDVCRDGRRCRSRRRVALPSDQPESAAGAVRGVDRASQTDRVVAGDADLDFVNQLINRALQIGRLRGHLQSHPSQSKSRISYSRGVARQFGLRRSQGPMRQRLWDHAARMTAPEVIGNRGGTPPAPEIANAVIARWDPTSRRAGHRWLRRAKNGQSLAPPRLRPPTSRTSN